MDRLTRKELKRDKFALEVTHTVDYLSEHRRQVTRYSVIAAVILALVIAVYFYRKHQQVVRQEALSVALRIQEAQVGAASSDVLTLFPTQEEKDKAALKAFAELAKNYPGSMEGVVARYYLGSIAVDKGNNAEAEKCFREVIDSGYAEYGSLAKLSLAEFYAGQGKASEAEKLYRSLIEKPTAFVSKEQATIALAKLIGPRRPAEARKLLEPLRIERRGAISRAALTALSELPSQ